MYNVGSDSKYKPRLTNCLFIQNRAKWGGGVDNENSSPILINCVFNTNSADYGGAILNIWSNPVVRNCILSCNVAHLAGGGISNHDNSSPSLANCTFAGNRATTEGGAISNYEGGSSLLTNCVLWSDIPNEMYVSYGALVATYSDVQGRWTGDGNIDVAPWFADPNKADYHLKSQAGRWDPNEGRWTIDDVTSPCIDAGDPTSPIGLEPFPNGGRINMGAYGGTSEASNSYFGGPVCETIVAGDINGDCSVDFADFDLMAARWLQALPAVNSNSMEKDGVEYYIQTDKVTYHVGEHIRMSYRVTNLAGDYVRLGEVLADLRDYYTFRVKQDSNVVWRYSGPAIVMAFEEFELNPYESNEFEAVWNTANGGSTSWAENDDFPAAPGLYSVVGELDLVRGERVPVSVDIKIIPE